MRRIIPGVRRCAPHLRGTRVELDIRFASSGEPVRVEVHAAPATPEQRTCMARAAERARVPPFSNPQLNVRFPVQF